MNIRNSLRIRKLPIKIPKYTILYYVIKIFFLRFGTFSKFVPTGGKNCSMQSSMKGQTNKMVEWFYKSVLEIHWNRNRIRQKLTFQTGVGKVTFAFCLLDWGLYTKLRGDDATHKSASKLSYFPDKRGDFLTAILRCCSAVLCACIQNCGEN